MNYTCFLDMDGVLVDFVYGSEKKWGKKYDGQYSFWKSWGITDDEFWASCDRKFWAGLRWTKEGPEIVTHVEKKFGRENICLLTSPCYIEGCMEGKQDWIKMHMPEYIDQFLMGRAKFYAAGPGKILIDDNEDHVRIFTEKGGVGVLVPCPWNKFSQWDTAILPYLRDVLPKGNLT